MHKCYLFLLLALLCACTSRLGIRTRTFRQYVEESPVFQRSFTGFALYDTEREEMVYTYQADKYFTPASNTKIFTLFAGLKMLGPQIPALQYEKRGDSLLFTGTGDPTWLHPDISSIDTTYDQTVYRFLANENKTLWYVERPIEDLYFGPGWAWDDYGYYYSSEKSGLPIYANVVRFQFQEYLPKPLVYPSYFTSYLHGFPDTTLRGDYVVRDQHQNVFTYAPKEDTLELAIDVPFIQSSDLLVNLLQDTLKKEVQRYPQPYHGLSQTLYGVPTDSVYRRMMQISDNFIAEQLLLVCSSTQRDTLSSEWTIDYVEDHFLQDVPDAPVWVDGSGLSRYNLQTPRTMVAVLQKVDSLLGDERIKNIFPAGGVSGTVEDWYENAGGEPYVFAKTGTLSNKHCLSGFLYTRKGKKLIFSFMHNNYVTSSSVLKVEMARILREIYEKY